MDEVTDEEIAIEASYHKLVEWSDHCQECELESWPCMASRLIVALRASREEVKELQAALNKVWEDNCGCL